MPTVIVNAGRIMNAKGVFLEGDRISGKASDLQPLVDAGSAHWEADAGLIELDEVDMTERAGEIALSAGLTPSDFEGRDPSGVTGFTVADVEAILAEREG